MGIINYIKNLLRKRQEVRTLPEQEIKNYILNQKQQYRMDTILDFERRNFLYGDSQNG